MSTLNYQRQLMIAGSIFTLHNIEEAIGFSRFSYPSSLNQQFQWFSSQSMIAAIISITILAWLVILWALFSASEITKRDVLTILVTIFAINAFFPHIVGTIILQRYFPAVISAIILYIPYSGWILPKLAAAFPTRKNFYLTVFIGLSIAVFIIGVIQAFCIFLI